MKHGLLAEFESPEGLVLAVEAVRRLGYRELDVFTPFPVREAEEALALPRSRIPVAVFVAGLSACVGAYLLQWWTAAIDYPLNVASFPTHSAPSFIPITFESTILIASITAFVAVFVKAGLPRLWDPTFEVEGFERASIDRFFLAIDAADPHFDRDRSTEELLRFAPLRVVAFEGSR
jgi:hypothetical protein